MGTTNMVKYLQEAYSDEKLCALLAHAEDGKLSYHSCDCLVGATTAPHALRGVNTSCVGESNHLVAARKSSSVAHAAEAEFLCAGVDDPLSGPLSELYEPAKADARRRAIVIPLIRAEIARREGVQALLEKWASRKQVMQPALVCCA